MLLADSELAAGASVAACAIAMVTGIFGWLSSRESRLQARDKLKYDAKMVQLTSDVAHLTDEHADCEERHQRLASEVGQLRLRFENRMERRRGPDANPDFQGPERRDPDSIG